jgi:hypothetical protein
MMNELRKAKGKWQKAKMVKTMERGRWWQVTIHSFTLSVHHPIILSSFLSPLSPVTSRFRGLLPAVCGH